MNARAPLVAVFILALAQGAEAGPFYTVPFPASTAITGAQALASLPDRVHAVTQRLACGSDLDFLTQLQSKATGEDPLAIVLAKMAWLAGLQSGVASTPTLEDCTTTRSLGRDFLSGLKLPSGGNLPSVIAADRFEGQAEVNRALEDATHLPAGPNVCNYEVTSITPTPNDLNAWTFTFKVSFDCLRQQINTALMNMQVDGQLGRSGLPCWSLPLSDFSGKTHGEWDVSVRALTRVLYFSDQHGMIGGNKGPLLDQRVREHVRDDLLTVSGPMRYEESYSWMQCGNEERDTGTPQDLADQRGFWHDVENSLGDFWDWLKHHWSLLLLAVPGTAELELFASGYYTNAAPAVLAAVAVAGAGAGAVLRIPETENHLLQIETSRFLKNQLIIRELGDYPGVDDFRSDQEDIKYWLLQHLQRYINDDFSEYNARPYQRYSINAILNLADFSDDVDLKTGARIVLEYLTAKFALGSLQARRFVPYRRLVEQMYSDQNEWPVAGAHRHLFDFAEGADHQIARMLLLTGLTAQLQDVPDQPPGQPKVWLSDSAPAEMIYQATSGYAPDAAIVDLAFTGTLGSYDQWIRHTTYEVFSRGTGFLVSGGGLRTGPANRAQIAGVDVPGTGNTNDEGVALPITLMTVGDTTGQNLSDVLRIEGPKTTRAVEINHWGNVDSWTFDHNVCVYEGFACGLNIMVPSPLEGCAVKRDADAGGHWEFIDTAAATCSAFKIGMQRLFITIYEHDCSSSDDGCDSNFGFFQVASSNLDGMTTDQLVAKVIADDSAENMAYRPHGQMSGQYHDPFGGSTIVYNSVGHQHDSSRWGIAQVNGVATGKLDDHDRADGHLWQGGGRVPLTASRDKGVIHIYNNRLGVDLALDFSDLQHPLYPGH